MKRPTQNTTGILLAFLATGMLGMAFAAVPIYQMFCQKTGFGGTTQRAEVPSGQTVERTLNVRFNADVHRDLPWRFRPTEVQIQIKVGENAMTHYESENYSREPIVGMATYNVTPDKAGIYFRKVHCFCFDEQTLMPGQKVDMPVLFYIDPEFATDPNMADVQTITLSYTFFKFKK
ncbi:cytochrome c oxidase assembly protein [Candidatus Paracaedibacter symbiosus]|uniref:cytochrome c oxidase assembly protein n=1 Tax=Candidatus Paracaedibacter symbiosus TaxID=244582 RepID=UPI00050952FC|nr:cytochrome c oxidase assembly protein [Candidatus Paracaedibacter symbiosus]